MLFKSVCAALVGVVAVADAVSVSNRFGDVLEKRKKREIRLAPIASRQLDQSLSSRQSNGSFGDGSTTLESDVIASGSASDGNPSDGESASLTDNANFINFCAGKSITNGLQQEGGSCNPIVMGDIPSTNNMITAMMLSPQHNEDISADQDFDVQVQVDGLTAGSFTNADSTYYSAPQQLDSNGNIIGHTHIVIQDMGDSLTPSSTLDPNTFAFFKGIDDAGDGNGLLSVTVTGGLPAGNYRVCSMTSASNHQPALMPIAQRGPQDDCNKFTAS